MEPSAISLKDASKKPPINKYALACALLASTNSILLGYDIGVMSGAVLFIKDNLKISSIQVEILVGSLNVCSLIGSFASGRTSDWIGRRYTIVLAASTFFMGALLMGLAPNFGFLMAGRVVAGIGVGFSLMISPVYTAEVSPALTRGLLTSLPEVFITMGILLGYIFNYALSGLPANINWRLMLGLAAVPAVGVAAGVMFMPESPRWLVMKGKVDEAKDVLTKTSVSEEEANQRLDEITKAALDVVACDPRADTWRGQGVWKELLKPSPAVRRILIAAVGINFFMQASGNDAVVYYTPEVFKAAGIHKRKQLVGVTIIMGLAKTSFVLVSAFFLDHFGRRPLLLLGSIGMCLSLFGLGLGSKFLEHSNPKPTWAIALCVVAVCADVSFFSIGLGPITWVYTSEIFPMRLRAQGSSLAVSVNRLVSGVVSMTFLTISNKITFGGMFFVLSGVMAVATVFFYFLLPETKGKSLEEIGVVFEKDDIKGGKVMEMSERCATAVLFVIVTVFASARPDTPRDARRLAQTSRFFLVLLLRSAVCSPGHAISPQDKWRNMCVSGSASDSRERAGIPRLQGLTIGSPLSSPNHVSAIPLLEYDSIVDPSESSQHKQTAPKYDAMIFEAILSLKDSDGPDPHVNAIHDFIEVKHVKETVFSANVEKVPVARSAQQMMTHLSVPVHEDV